MTQPSTPRLRAQALLRQGLDASQQPAGDEILDVYQQSAAEDPTWGIPHFLMGSHYAARGDIEKAELSLSNAVLLSPDFPMARYQLGTLQFSSGRAAAALVSWQPLLGLPGDSPLPHFVRAYAALAQDDFDSAVRHYEEGLEKNTDNAALTGDIRKILARIASLKAAAQEPTAAPTVDGADMKHVLLSNYQR